MRDVSAACADFAEDLSALLDGELAREREGALRTHVDGCEECSRRLAALARVDLALASAPLPALPDDLRARLGERIAREVATAPGPRVEAPARRAAPRPHRRWLAGPALGLAAAAAAALAFYLALRPDGETLPGAPGEAPRVADRRPAPPQVLEAPLLPAPAPAPPRQIAGDGLAEPSDADLEELALVLELDTIEDLDVIANLDLLERLIALEDRASG